MQSLKDIQKNSYEHMSSNEVKHMNSYEERIDEAVDKYKNLRLNEDYRTLHCWHAHRLGVDRFVGLAKEAMQHGRYPAKYFTYLLKTSN